MLPETEQASPLVQALPSSHVLPAASGVCVQAPAEHASVVHGFESSVHAVPSAKFEMVHPSATSQDWQTLCFTQTQLVVDELAFEMMVSALALAMMVVLTGCSPACTSTTSPAGIGLPSTTGRSHAPPQKAASRNTLLQVMTRTA